MENNFLRFAAYLDVKGIERFADLRVEDVQNYMAHPVFGVTGAGPVLTPSTPNEPRCGGAT
jgi:hypothetical protein